MTEENANLFFIPQLIFKVCVIADPQVSKANLLRKVCTPQDNYRNTLGVNLIKKNITIADFGEVSVQIWDLGPQEYFKSLRRLYLEGANGAIIIYDVSRLSTLDIVPEKIQEIRKFCGDIPIFMLGIIHPYRTIPIEKIAKINEKYKLSGFYEVTPESGKIVENMLKQMAKIIYERYMNST
jgi:GTPase SAR1 family protein